MRRLLPGDVEALAAALGDGTLSDGNLLERRARTIVEQAETADKYVRRFRRVHPRWGDGSLMSAALRHVPSGGRLDMNSESGLRAMAVAARVLAEWKAAPGRISRRRRTYSA